MFYIKICIVFCIIIFTIACASNTNLTPLLSGNNFILIETAVDNSIENSRNKAITLLSQDIFVNIKNNFSQKEILKNNIYNTYSLNEVTSTSIGYFKDLVFSNTQYINKGNYKTSVGLTQASIINTINYLNNNIKFSLVSLLDRSSLEDEYHKIQFLIALITFADSKNIKYQNINLQKLITYREELDLRLSNAAKLNFNILPNLNNIAKINILDTNYNPNDTIFVSPGIYYYTVYAKDYKTLTNKIEVRAQDNLYIDLYLQKLLDKPIKVKLNIISEQPNFLKESIVTQIKYMIEKYQLTVNNYTNNTLTIELLTPISTMINNYYYNNLPINIIFTDKNTIKLSQTFKITYVTSKQNTNLSPNILLAKLEEFLSELTAGSNLSNLSK